MKISQVKLFLLNKEVWLHIILWALFFASINVNWTKSWIAESFLPESVAPHTALAVPAIFLINVFWLIPKFLNKTQWMRYLWLSTSLFFGFEIIRAFVFSCFLSDYNSFREFFKNELFGENSLVFGILNVLIFHSLFYSFVYRFTRDWILNQSVIETLKLKNLQLELNSLEIVGIDKNHFETMNISTIKSEIETIPVKKTFTVKKRDGVFLLYVKDIVYFQAQGDFVFAFDNSNNKHIINESLKTIKTQICQGTFFQINRSELVNFNFITKFKSYTKNRLEVSVNNEMSILYTSNSRTPEFRLWIDKH
ncbi:LytTR family DNA-binding domain-containing protein [uncultured Lacinutrix sp.]|uniref:LytR/AlgR family response regulator transcription factor n=1 Tax=uncultured Lacinutrix sp. TaxID=574032 RepID=UPI0026046D17|nr:LytTR family DNA-binding domain-containing protein [uncultured Lacinutrix sp.]